MVNNNTTQVIEDGLVAICDALQIVPTSAKGEAIRVLGSTVIEAVVENAPNLMEDIDKQVYVLFSRIDEEEA